MFKHKIHCLIIQIKNKSIAKVHLYEVNIKQDKV